MLMNMDLPLKFSLFIARAAVVPMTVARTAASTAIIMLSPPPSRAGGVQELYRFHGDVQEHQRLVENEAFILEAIDLVSRKYPDVKILESNWWDVLPQEVIDRVFEDVEFPGCALEHAAVTETSLMMYLRPDLVREEYIPGDTDFTAIPYHKYPVVKGMVPDTGALASARGSSAEKGRLLA